MTEDRLRIVRIDLLKESLKTYRDLNKGGNPVPVTYPMLVWLSGVPDAHERINLAEVGILTTDNDPMQAIIRDTTLEQVRNQMQVWNGRIDMAARNARAQREVAEAEDQRLKALVAEINEELKPLSCCTRRLERLLAGADLDTNGGCLSLLARFAHSSNRSAQNPMSLIRLNTCRTSKTSRCSSAGPER